MSGPDTDERVAESADESATPAETPGTPTAAWVSLLLAVAVSMPVLALALLSARTPAREPAAPGAVVRQTVVQQLGLYRFELPPGYVFRSYRAGPDEPGGGARLRGLIARVGAAHEGERKGVPGFGVGGCHRCMGVLAQSGKHRGAVARDPGKANHPLAVVPLGAGRWLHPSPLRGRGFFQLYLSDTDSGVSFECTDPEPGTSPACSRTEELAPELIASFDYGYKYRFQTPEISARIRRFLLDDMRVTGAP